MEKGELVARVLDDNVIRDDVTLEPTRQLLTQGLIGIDPNVVRAGKQPNVGIEVSFGVKDAGLLSRLGTRLPNVIRGLPIQKTNAVDSRDTQLRPGG